MTQAEISAQVGVQVATAMTTTLVPIIKGKLNEKQDAEDGKGLSTEDYTTAEKNKLAGIASGAEVNVIDSITVNSTAATVSNKTVALTIPTKVSDISNDSGFQTAEQVEASIDAKVSGVYRASESATLATLPALTKANLGRVSNMIESFTTTADFIEGAGITFPLGTNVVIVEALGGGYKYDVLAGFVDLSGKQDKLTVTGAANKGVYVSASGVVSAMTYEVNANVPANFAAASVAPLMDGIAAVGSSMKYAREDHVHPQDDNKVDKVTGKGLSTNDYTDADKNKLSGIEAQANKTTIDNTLSNTGQAADAKATGDHIAALRNYIASMDVDRNASGNPATFYDAKSANVKALSVTLTPTQSGSGDPSPSNVRPITGVSSVHVTRTGKNLFSFAGQPTSADAYGVTFVKNFNADGSIASITLNGTNSGSNSADFWFDTASSNPFLPAQGSFYISLGLDAAISGLRIIIGRGGGQFDDFTTSGILNGTLAGAFLAVAPGTTLNNVTVRPIAIYADIADRSYEPPRRQTQTVALVDSNNNPLTVYGGTLDVTSGTLSVAWDGIASYAGETLPGRWISDRDVYASGNAPTTGAQVVYELATPVTYTLTPQQFATLPGYNAISSKAGAVDVTYKADTSLVWGGIT